MLSYIFVKRSYQIDPSVYFAATQVRLVLVYGGCFSISVRDVASEGVFAGEALACIEHKGQFKAYKASNTEGTTHRDVAFVQGEEEGHAHMRKAMASNSENLNTVAQRKDVEVEIAAELLAQDVDKHRARPQNKVFA